PCPITFLDDGEVSAFDFFKDYVKSRYLEQFCPFLYAPGDFSLDFVEYMRSKLRLEIKNDVFLRHCASSADKNSLRYREGGPLRENRVTGAFHQKVLTDHLTMGKDPRLADGLSSLVGRIRFAKIIDSHSDKKIQARQILNIAGLLPAPIRTYTNYKMINDQGLFIADIGILGKYLEFIDRFLNLSNDSYFWMALIHHGADAEKGEDFNNSVFQSFLQDFTIPEYDRWAQENPDRPVMEFAVHLFSRLDEADKHDYRKVLSMVLSRPESTYTISAWRLFLFFMLDFTEQNNQYPGYFWDWDSVKIFQYLTRKEVLVAWGELSYPFNSREIDAALQAIIKALKKANLSPYDIVETAWELSAFFTDWYMGAGEGGVSRIYQLEKSLQYLASRPVDISYVKSLNVLLEKMNQKQKDFSDNPASSLADELPSLMDFLVKNWGNFLHLYSRHFIASKRNFPDNHGQKLMLSYRDLLRQNNPRGFYQLSSLLSDERLGTWQQLYGPLLFDDGNRKMVFELLDDLHTIKREDLTKMIEEMNLFLPRMHTMIKYVDDHVVPYRDTSMDILNLLKTIRRAGEFQNPVWSSNRELLLKWLDFPNP
ncbi:MAG: hypothetical protein OXB84_01320, partial [Halobacteriovoraceae bacterium]|nr:hypothetical protein [Halobacteriovoraceae bacterium]